MAGASQPGATRLTFRPRHRLTHARQFQAVYARGVRRSAGPMLVTVLPNELPHCRLGLSIGKKLGGATVRNRFKRLLREAFRLGQNDLPIDHHAETPRGFDLVVALRPHDAMPLERYRELLLELSTSAAREALRRGARERERPAGADASPGGTGGKP